jgi:hypothetical protein
MTNHSGKDGTATINGAEIPLTGWSVNPTSDIVGFRNSKTGKFTKRETTFKDLTFSIDLDFDFDANPFAVGVGLIPGAALTNVKLYLNGVAGLFHNIPEAIVTGTPQSLTVEGKIITRVNGVTNGTYALAGGVTP